MEQYEIIKREITEEKLKANSFFKSKDYVRAEEGYNKCLYIFTDAIESEKIPDIDKMMEFIQEFEVPLLFLFRFQFA